MTFLEVRQALARGSERGLDRAAEMLLAESNRRIPTLRGTTERTGKTSRDGLKAAVSYDTDYVVDLHEDLDNYHDDGEAKFLENAGNALRSEIAEAVVAQIRAQLGT